MFISIFNAFRLHLYMVPASADIMTKKDPMGAAMRDYFHSGDNTLTIAVESNITEGEEIAVPYLFRSYKDFPELEKLALEHCHGKILDVGAGAGIHSLVLQQKGMEVTALEKSTAACEVMTARGVKNVINDDFYNHKGKYDTLIFLMNGLGIAGTLEGLEKLLLHAKTLLNPGGKILCDSSDIIYMYEEEDGSYLINLNGAYYGQLEYQMSYKDETSEYFDWLFIDFDYLKEKASSKGYICSKIHEGEHYDYLAELHL